MQMQAYEVELVINPFGLVTEMLARGLGELPLGQISH